VSDPTPGPTRWRDDPQIVALIDYFAARGQPWLLLTVEPRPDGPVLRHVGCGAPGQDRGMVEKTMEALAVDFLDDSPGGWMETAVRPLGR